MFFKDETFFEVVEDRFREHKDSEVVLPTRAHKDDAGYDLYAPCDLTLEGANFTDDSKDLFDSKVLWLDVKVSLPASNVMLVTLRSGVSNKTELALKNGFGVIDSRHYHNKKNGGNIGLIIRNLSKKPHTIKKGDRIAQGLIVPYGVVLGDYYYRSSDISSGGLGGTGN